MSKFKTEDFSMKFESHVEYDGQKNPIGERYKINGKNVVCLGGQGPDVKTDWDKPENLKGEFLPLEGFPIPGARCVPCVAKSLTGQPFAGFFIKTPQSQEIWREV